MADVSDTDSGDDPLRHAKIIKSAYDSESFDSDGTFNVDGLVGSASISPSGRDIALASPEGLAIIDLDAPYSAPRRVKSHGMPWLVVDVQWSPFAARDYWVASTANHCCLIWNLNRPDDSSAGAVEHSLRGHQRSITDMNFSAHHPDMLATCSVDGYVHCWDLRRSSTPALTFIDWVAGATQVKYNRQDEHVIASSHNRCVHIWDDRKASLPLRTIEAHTSKIYGLDWNRTRRTSLVTCSLDKTIKFWDYTATADASGNNGLGGPLNNLTVRSGFRSRGALNDHDVPERVIRTTYPVWRARHTPFGEGVLAMPQTAPGYLYMYDARSPTDLAADGPGALQSANEPTAVFQGHGHHRVKEFLWRTRGTMDSEVDNREFQLVSLGEDSKLRLRRLDSSDLAAARYHRGQRPLKNLNLTRRGATYKTFRVLEDMGDYEKRSATMSSLRPKTRPSRPSSPTHHHHAEKYAEKYAERRPTKTSRPLASALKATPASASSTSIVRDMRDGARSPTLTPQRPKHDHRISWRNPSMRAASAHASRRRHADRAKANEQLDWMKGVTLNKRKTSTEAGLAASGVPGIPGTPGMTASQERLMAGALLADAYRKVSSDSAVSSPMQLSMHDATTLSLASEQNESNSTEEEIKSLTTKLPHVNWDANNIDKLRIGASMRGPWGAQGQPVFFKVDVDVPASYPLQRAPRFSIENSALVPKATQQEIVDSLSVITDAFLARERRCLLAAFRYLLGETDLDGSLALLQRGLSTSRLLGDDSDGVSSSSSDDDDDGDGDGDGGHAYGETISGDGAMAPALPPPPPPRSCGAYFTRDGRLVAFSLTRSGKATAKIMFEPAPPPTQDELSALQQPVFIGFGKVLPSGPGASRRHRKAVAAATGGADWCHDSESSSSADSDSASSDSDASASSASTASASASASASGQYRRTADGLVDPWSSNMGFQRRVVRGKERRRRASNDQRVLSAYLDPGIPTGPQSTVDVVDVRAWLPSKKALAREYAIFGDGADVCTHNARVAASHGEADLADIWRYAAMLLKSDVPLQLAAGDERSVLVIARSAVSGPRVSGSQVSSPPVSSPPVSGPPVSGPPVSGPRPGGDLRGRVKWGLHPLARAFVSDLFAYFEQLADIQMLAMLSCIFGESFEEDSVAYAESHLSLRETPLTMKAPSFSLDYRPSAPLRTFRSGTSTPRQTADNSSFASFSPAAVFLDGSIDVDDADDADDTWPDDVSGSATPPTPSPWLSRRNTLTGHDKDLSSSPLGDMNDRFRRRGMAVVAAIAEGIPQTLDLITSSSPNDHTHAHPLPVPIPMSSSLSRHASFFGWTPSSRHSSRHSSRPSPHSPARTTYLPTTHARTPLATPGRDARLASHTHRLLADSAASFAPASVLGKFGATLTADTDTGADTDSAPPPPPAPPPTALNTTRKRPSPAETIFGNLTGGNLTWAASALFGGSRDSGGSATANTSGAATPAATGGTSAVGSAGTVDAAGTVPDARTKSAARRDRGYDDPRHDDGARQPPRPAPVVAVGVDIAVRTCNDHLFDDDGWMFKSLLGGGTDANDNADEDVLAAQRRRRLYAQYRYAYSELLQDWGESLARLEVLKFNVLRGDAVKAADEGHGTAGTETPLFRGKHAHLTAVRDSGRGLDVVGICQLCELQLEPLEYDPPSASLPHSASSKRGGGVGTCRRCRRHTQPRVWVQSLLRCVYCTEPVDAIYIPCFGCGCASHPDCLRAWYQAGEKFCAAGDECPCPEDATAGRVESWTALQAQLGTGGGTGAPHDAHDGFRKGLIAEARASAPSAPRFFTSALASLESVDRGSRDQRLAVAARRAAAAAAYQPRPATAVAYDARAPTSGLAAAMSSASGLTSSGFWGRSVISSGSNDPAGGATHNAHARRSRLPASGLRQQLQQQQLETKQQHGHYDTSQGVRRTRSQEFANTIPTTSSATPSTGATTSPTANVSPARLSLSSRLLGGARLRGQADAAVAEAARPTVVLGTVPDVIDDGTHTATRNAHSH